MPPSWVTANDATPGFDLQKGLQPEQADHGLRVRDPAVADHGDRFVQGKLEDFEKLPGVELRGLLGELLDEKELDRLVGVADRGVDDAEAGPLRGDVPGLLEQLALRGLQVRLVGLELARRDLDELAPMRVTELPLE